MKEEIRAERLVRTRDAAAALVEDLAHMRQVLKSAPSRDELRRLSSTLRRILVDRDLTTVAAPRINRILLTAPDNKPIIKTIRSLKIVPAFFGSAGVGAFGIRYRAITAGPGHTLQPEDRTKLFATETEETVQLKLDGFLSQPVFLFQGEWANRRDVIKYMANVASGVHSGAPHEPTHVLLQTIRRAVTYSRRSGLYFNTKAFDGIDIPFRYEPDALDVVLLELMAAASFLVSSDDTIKLERSIHDELRAFAPRGRADPSP
jgi:hypothetical protein